MRAIVSANRMIDAHKRLLSRRNSRIARERKELIDEEIERVRVSRSETRWGRVIGMLTMRPALITEAEAEKRVRARDHFFLNPWWAVTARGAQDMDRMNRVVKVAYFVSERLEPLMELEGDDLLLAIDATNGRTYEDVAYLAHCD